MTFLELLLCLGLIFGPIVGYVPQYMNIMTSQDPGGFSPLVCFILIAANILRVFFWVLKGFELTLLYQSVMMIAAQLVLLELIVRVQLKNRSSKNHSNKDGRLNYDVTRGSRVVYTQPVGFDMENFWQWDYFGEYLAFLGLFGISIATVTILNKLIFGSTWVTETVGGLALMIESTLAMPQFYSNWKSKTSGGLRY